ncbi:hypothetical protein B0H19DRAFT_1061645 [Mycena capillaripes]|nr:hypothetical protein B0H19DRAFT_1061645 [Mycena capillaripes]
MATDSELVTEKGVSPHWNLLELPQNQEMTTDSKLVTEKSVSLRWNLQKTIGPPPGNVKEFRRERIDEILRSGISGAIDIGVVEFITSKQRGKPRKKEKKRKRKQPYVPAGWIRTIVSPTYTSFAFVRICRHSYMRGTKTPLRLSTLEGGRAKSGGERQEGESGKPQESKSKCESMVHVEVRISMRFRAGWYNSGRPIGLGLSLKYLSGADDVDDVVLGYLRLYIDFSKREKMRRFELKTREIKKFKLRLSPIGPPELYQSAYGKVLALRIALNGRLVTSLALS